MKSADIAQFAVEFGAMRSRVDAIKVALASGHSDTTYKIGELQAALSAVRQSLIVAIGRAALEEAEKES